MSYDNRNQVEKLKDEIEQLKRDRDAWKRQCDEWRQELELVQRERDRFQASAIQDGQAVLVYTDEGPKGPCAQAMNVMAPRTAVHVFPDVDALKAFARQHFQTVSDHCKRPVIRYFVIGEEGGDTLTIHGHEESANPNRCALCDQNPRDFESKDAP